MSGNVHVHSHTDIVFHSDKQSENSNAKTIRWKIVYSTGESHLKQ